MCIESPDAGKDARRDWKRRDEESTKEQALFDGMQGGPPAIPHGWLMPRRVQNSSHRVTGCKVLPKDGQKSSGIVVMQNKSLASPSEIRSRTKWSHSKKGLMRPWRAIPQQGKCGSWGQLQTRRDESLSSLAFFGGSSSLP